jgi:3-deoxy-manno-octulosonate cytidylyltransferase (CMP-KDO synthetase)
MSTRVRPFRVVIPARYGSSRFPGKPLAELAGRPLLAWVYERAARSRASEILIATDDARIERAARGFGASVVMTSASHASGTDRIAEVAVQRGWPDADVIVNVQGDEPLLPPALIDQVADALAEHAQAAIATVVAPILSLSEFLDPNAVKVVADAGGRALYFSRAPIPWHRNGNGAASGPQPGGPQQFAGALRHIGLYAYRVGALRQLAAIAPSALEQAEKLEQLRALEHGLEIRVVRAVELPGPDVNTAEDLQRVARHLAAQG